MLKLLYAHLSESSVDCSLKACARIVIEFPADGGDLVGPVRAIERIDMELFDDVLDSIVVSDGWVHAILREPITKRRAIGRVPIAVMITIRRIPVAVALGSVPVRFS